MSKPTVHSTTVLTYKGINLIVYQGKNDKNVLLLISLHPTIEIACNSKKLLLTIVFYKVAKYNGDMIDQMTRKYKGKSASHRWPKQIFFFFLNSILDLVSINASVSCKTKFGKK